MMKIGTKKFVGSSFTEIVEIPSVGLYLLV